MEKKHKQIKEKIENRKNIKKIDYQKTCVNG